MVELRILSYAQLIIFIRWHLQPRQQKFSAKKDDYNKYHNLAEETLKAIHEEYFSQRGRCCVLTQTALSLAIIHGLQPEGKIKTSFGSLSKLLMDKDYHLCTHGK